MGRDDEQTNIRIPSDLKRKLQDEAVRNSRTFTAEVVSRLQASFDEAGDLHAAIALIQSDLADMKKRMAPKKR